MLPLLYYFSVPQLCAEQDGVRFGTSQALRNLIRDCVNAEMIAAAVSTAAKGKAPMGGKAAAPAPAASVVAAVASLLGARYQEAWSLALPGAI